MRKAILVALLSCSSLACAAPSEPPAEPKSTAAGPTQASAAPPIDYNSVPMRMRSWYTGSYTPALQALGPVIGSTISMKVIVGQKPEECGRASVALIEARERIESPVDQDIGALASRALGGFEEAALACRTQDLTQVVQSFSRAETSIDTLDQLFRERYGIGGAGLTFRRVANPD